MNLSQTARYLVLLTSAMMTYFGLGTLLNLGSHPELIGWFAAYAMFAFLEATVLLFCYYRLKYRNKRVFQIAIVILALNAVLAIFDQVGLIDILYLLLNLVTLGALYLSRKDFLPE